VIFQQPQCSGAGSVLRTLVRRQRRQVLVGASAASDLSEAKTKNCLEHVPSNPPAPLFPKKQFDASVA
jgi:hypothetical protein